jgi:site-specific DNA-cytosine methylase
MKVAVLCEFSGIVRDAFRKAGHDAWSCDILPTESNPAYHYQCDIREILHYDWDMMIAHPPCTYFSTAGANWLFRGGKLNEDRWKQGLKMKQLFMDIYNCKCPKIAIENPVSMKIWELPQYTQEIQPYQFGHPFTKKTRLWLKGLPELIPTNIVEPMARWVSCGYKGKTDNAVCKTFSNKRSRTFQGIADAMAEQWGGFVC